MKKFLLGVFALISFGFFAAAQDIPTFTGDGAERAMLIDIKAAGKVKDNIVVVNMATNEAIGFDVYVYDEKKGWISYGFGNLKNLNDTCKLEASNTKAFGKYRYAAVVMNDNVRHSFKTSVAHSDLYCYVLPENISYDSFGKGAVEIDVSIIQKKLKDNIRFVSKAKKASNTGFFIFADNGDGFKLIGTSFLKTYADTCFAEKCDGNTPPSKYSKYAIKASDGKKYEYTPKAESSDLYIYVLD